MILSVSRRTDVPAHFSDWFFERMREGYVLTRNPMNPRQLSRIALSPDGVDCIVFWSKNPAPMLDRLEEIKEYMYYFQFTLNGYDRDIEVQLPPLDERLQTFRALSQRVGPERIIWRYDPILLTEKYSLNWHAERFCEIASALSGCAQTCTISFLDLYASIAGAVKKWDMRPPDDDEKRQLAAVFSSIARGNGFVLCTCAEEIDLGAYGIGHASCIDGHLIERLLHCPLKKDKDKNQRKNCGCVSAIDIGMYNTCPNGCAYCYANHSPALRAKNLAAYDPCAPMLCGNVQPEDKIRDREMKTLKIRQTTLF